jgi:hypothetical protein
LLSNISLSAELFVKNYKGREEIKLPEQKD